ncbi:allophanate hydrolase subunit 1 [Actinocatenispora sera]|uniref:Allophanate hydrolase n=1 Tax=Actinocatenispora sera TaxID=390989 RepID=A0A810KXI9_9ACTN|nr:allophanate hydrolase subunit 1 [Actinocatenispora sera]BCJ26961.1 allophanate hydrolase [Actinocatenispora sera]
MRIRPAGPHAVLLECADAAEVAAWHAEVQRRRASGALAATDLVPAARTVLVDGVPDPAALAASLADGFPAAPTGSPAGGAAAFPSGEQAGSGGGTVENRSDEAAERPARPRIPPVGAAHVELDCVYDGPDLAEVAELWGTSVDGVVARHTGTEFRVAFCGFSPGFGYLTGLPAELAVPRRDSPRPRVPAGSVGLAGEYSGVYPSPSPGGWRLIGRTDRVLFDPDASPPALLTPGTRVTFRAVRG